MVHFPTVYRGPSTGDDGNRYYYDVILQILGDAERGCVVLLDPDGAIDREIEQAIAAWPPRHKKRVQLLRAQLKKRHRLITLASSARAAGCRRSGCAAAAGVAACSAAETPWVILPDSCAAGASCLTPTRRVLRIDEYTTSELVERVRRLDVRHIPAETPLAAFETEVIRPLFRYTKHVKVFDRWIGRSMLEANLRGDERPNWFLTSLAWLFDQFAVWSAPRDGRLFEVTTGIRIDSPQSRSVGIQISRQFAEWARELTARHGPDGPVLQLRVKEEAAGRELPHDRFLITDQIALNVTGGFDLLRGARGRQWVREATLSQEREPGAIELGFRARPDLR
ncbi:MAG: hypothetical protein ACRDIY_01830 [Chloroflexota bacterium]